jgi:hypothetical protein
MANLKISQLPEYSGNTSGSYLVMNNSGETITYKVKKENYIFPYNGNATITGSLTVSGSLVTFKTPRVEITGSNTFGDLVITNSGRTANAQIVVSSVSTSESSKTIHNSIVSGGQSELQLAHNSGSVWLIKSQNDFNMFNSFTSPSGSINSSFFSIANNPSTTNLAEPQFKRSVGITGSVNITSVMTLAQQSPLPTGSVGSLAVSGSNLFYYNGSSWSQIN